MASKEFAFYGPSPAAMRAALEDLLPFLRDLRIGHVTHPGSQAPSDSGAIESRNVVRLSAPAWDVHSRRAALADCDLVFVEGEPAKGAQGILVLTHDASPSADLRENPPLACVAPDARPTGLAEEVPVFHPSRLADLAAFLRERALAALRSAPVHGLVLVGGRSSRMRVDKASLAYHGKPQTEHCLELLDAHCSRSFLSCRADQADQNGFKGLPQIHDTFMGMGPLGGILSALQTHRDAAWLVVACDLPFLDAATLAALMRGRDPFKIATAFAGPQDGLPEPLCAVYEPASYPRMLQFAGQGIHCPRKVILNSSSRILAAPDLRSLLNANDPDAYQAALQALASK